MYVRIIILLIGFIICTSCNKHDYPGCTDPLACNYDVKATEDNNTCVYSQEAYDCEGICLEDVDGDGVCDELETSGCTDINASNYNFYATYDDGSCVYNYEITVTAFLYENCPIAQYMCGPLRDAYRYFCDTLNQDIVFRGISPNAFSTEETLENFVVKYDIPFNVFLDYNHINGQHDSYVQYYNPVVTPEVFIELNSDLVYRGMIDNSYQELGQWALPTENYIFDVLAQLINGETTTYFETTAIGCLINN